MLNLSVRKRPSRKERWKIILYRNQTPLEKNGPVFYNKTLITIRIYRAKKLLRSIRSKNFSHSLLSEIKNTIELPAHEKMQQIAGGFERQAVMHYVFDRGVAI